MQEVKFRFKKLHPNATTPVYSSEEAAGMDVTAVEDYFILSGDRVKIKTGLAFELPVGWQLECRSRSGLAAKGIKVANSPGTVDSDYRGEAQVILENNSPMGFSVKKGERIAQLVLMPAFRAALEETQEELSTTRRGSGGFGSTGV